MDLGIQHRKAIVCASSSGLGLACAEALIAEGVEVVINGRDPVRLATAATQLRAHPGAKVVAVAADLNDPQGRAALLASCPEPDILVTNNAGPPPGDVSEWTEAVWQSAIHANMMTPVLLIQAVLPGMRARGFGRIVNITSAMVKTPRPHQGLSAAARTGLTAFCKAVSFDAAADNVTINNLLPERIDTGRQQQMVTRMVDKEGITREQARARIVESLAAKRFGRPEEVGAACAFLCSQQASFISGQNLQLDGGSCPAVM